MRRSSKILAAVGMAASIATLTVASGEAFASDPTTSSVYDVNSTTATVGGGSSAILTSKAVECDTAAETLISGGVIETDATNGTPPNGDFFSTVYSAPQYGGSGAKDSWNVMVRTDAGTGSRTFSFTVYAICAK